MRRPVVVLSVKKAYSTISTDMISSTLGRPRKLASFQPTNSSAITTTALRAQKKPAGSGAMPNSASRARPRTPAQTMAAAARPTRTSAVKLGLSGPNRSGMKPVDSDWKDRSNGPMFWPPSSHKVRPRNTSIPASVTMKDGMRQ